jgi:hypothetical protein
LTWHCPSLSFCDFIEGDCCCSDDILNAPQVNQQNVPIELQTRNTIQPTPRVATQPQTVVSRPQQNVRVEVTQRPETLREVVVKEATRGVTRAVIQQVGIPTFGLFD